MYTTLKHGRAEYNSFMQVPCGVITGIVEGIDSPTEAGQKLEKFAHLVYDVAGLSGNVILNQTLLVKDTYSRIIKTSGDNTYIMYAPPNSLSGDPVWRMQLIDADGSRLWADGNINFDNAASAYLTKTYSL